MRVVSSWLKNIAKVHKNIRLQIGNASEKTRPTTNRDKPKTISFALKKSNLCFSSLSYGHRSGQCKSNRVSGKKGCSKLHNSQWHSEEKPDSCKTELKGAEGEQANLVAIVISCSGILQLWL